MSEQNEQVVLKFIEAFAAGDSAAAEPLLDPEAVTHAMGYTKFAGARDRSVILGTTDAIKALVPTGLRPQIKEVISSGDKVVVEWEGDGETVEGKPYRNQYCMVFTLKDGKVKQVKEYFCTIHADEVLWPLVEKMMSQNTG